MVLISAHTSDELNGGNTHYFAARASRLSRPERLEAARRAGLKTVAVVGAALPEELFWACGAAPVMLGRLAGCIGGLGDGSDGSDRSNGSDLPDGAGGVGLCFARDACAVARTAFELLTRHWIPAGLVDAVVVAAGCDWTARLGDRLDGRVPVWPLHAGRSRAGNGHGRNGAAHASVLAGLKQMAAALEELTDVPLAREAFLRSYDQSRMLDDFRDRLDALRVAGGLRASDFRLMTGALELADPERWVEEVELFFLHAAPPASFEPPDTPRVLLGGCPTGFPDDAFLRAVERSGLRIVGEDFHVHGPQAFRRPAPHGGRRDILHWAAQGLVDAASPLPPAEAEGTLWLHYRGCAASAMESATRRAESGPALVVELEQTSPVPEALRTRLEAFREQLLARRT